MQIKLIVVVLVSVFVATCGKQILLLLTFQLTKETGIACNGFAGQFCVRVCICPFSASLRWECKKIAYGLLLNYT